MGVSQDYLTKNFKRSEFACPCCGMCEMNKTFMLRLQLLRDEFGEALFVTSGFRCIRYNTSLENSSPTSKHMLGLAVDFHVSSSKAMRRLNRLADNLEFKGIGIGRNFIHIDDREAIDGVTWGY